MTHKKEKDHGGKNINNRIFRGNAAQLSEDVYKRQLWPRFEDQRVGLLLAFIGSINDEILNKDELAMELIRFRCV